MNCADRSRNYGEKGRMKSLAEVIGITPGPWYVERTSLGLPCIENEEEENIATPSHLQLGHIEANARAIAAVPKLLETIFKQCRDWEGQARYEDRGNYRQNPAYDDLKRFSKVLEETAGLTYEEIKRRMEE